MLVRLLYASRVAPECSPCQTAQSLLQDNRQYNAAHGITGILCYSEEVYVQALEGGRAQVNALYAKILCDPRHTDVCLLHYEEITERAFAGWTMGIAALDKVNPSTLLRYSATPKLDPFALPGKVSMSLLLELNASAAILGRA